MKPVVQRDRTGCAIASAAAIAGVSYDGAKKAATAMGISVHDDRLWSDTVYVRRLLERLGRRVASARKPFQSWDALPGCALLAIKWHRHGARASWHWVVYVRENGRRYVLDSKQALKSHVRRDFGRMRPKWYLAVMPRGSR